MRPEPSPLPALDETQPPTRRRRVARLLGAGLLALAASGCPSPEMRAPKMLPDAVQKCADVRGGEARDCVKLGDLQIHATYESMSKFWGAPVDEAAARASYLKACELGQMGGCRRALELHLLDGDAVLYEQTYRRIAESKSPSNDLPRPGAVVALELEGDAERAANYDADIEGIYAPYKASAVLGSVAQSAAVVKAGAITKQSKQVLDDVSKAARAGAAIAKAAEGQTPAFKADGSALAKLAPHLLVAAKSALPPPSMRPKGGLVGDDLCAGTADQMEQCLSWLAACNAGVPKGCHMAAFTHLRTSGFVASLRLEEIGCGDAPACGDVLMLLREGPSAAERADGIAALEPYCARDDEAVALVACATLRKLRDPRGSARLLAFCEQGSREACEAMRDDEPQAIKAAEAGCAAGKKVACDWIIGLAASYEYGSGVPKDPERAYRYRQMLCSHGVRGGCGALMAKAESYRRGTNGLPQDLKRAVAIYEEICAHGDGQTCAMFAGVLFDEPKVRDKARALKILRPICESANADESDTGCMFLLRTGDKDASARLRDRCQGGRWQSCNYLMVNQDKADKALAVQKLKAICAAGNDMVCKVNASRAASDKDFR